MRTDRLLMQDLLEAIHEVIATTPPTRAAFDADKMLRSHVLRHIQILGEAAWRLSKPLKDQNPQVPWRLLAGMRHVIIHDYFEIDWDEVYATAIRDVPTLKPLIESMLNTLPPEPK